MHVPVPAPGVRFARHCQSGFVELQRRKYPHLSAGATTCRCPFHMNERDEGTADVLTCSCDYTRTAESATPPIGRPGDVMHAHAMEQKLEEPDQQ